jgi:hypothetical protein
MTTPSPLDEFPQPAILDLRERVTRAFAGTSIDREERDHLDALADAVGALPAINAGIDGETARFLIPPIESSTPPRTPPVLPADGPSLARDRAAVLEVARYRMVSFAHLREFIYSGTHPSVLTRRMAALKATGFLTTWEERLTRGGHPRYALLTEHGMRFAMEALRQDVRGHAHEQLVRFMVGSKPRRPLILAPQTAPPFLPHQNETNWIAATFARRSALGVVWSSAWHRPFPNEVRGVAMPQPDAVLVTHIHGVPQLVFVEHDRAHESPGSFADRKTLRYQLLLDLGLAPELLGFATCTVLVTVTDPAHHRPLDRIRALQDVSRGASFMRFTVAEWAMQAPEAAVWFTPDTPVRSPSLTPADHHALVAPVSNLVP